MSQWEVLLDGENVWTIDGKPHTFATEQEAWDEIDDYFKDCEEAVALGYMEDVDYDINFRVAEVRQ
jgi:phospholipase C